MPEVFTPPDQRSEGKAERIVPGCDDRCRDRGAVALWRALGLEADRVVKAPRQQIAEPDPDVTVEKDTRNI